MKLPGPSTTPPGHRSAAARCNRRRRSLCAAGAPAPAIPVDDIPHPQLELGKLSPLDAIPAAGEPPPHRETPAAASSVPAPAKGLSMSPQNIPGAYVRAPKSFQGPRCKFPFPFSFVLKNSKLVNSFKNRRKIRKMQTQLLWNICKETYNFFYMHFSFAQLFLLHLKYK